MDPDPEVGVYQAPMPGSPSSAAWHQAPEVDPRSVCQPRHSLAAPGMPAKQQWLSVICGLRVCDQGSADHVDCANFGVSAGALT